VKHSALWALAGLSAVLVAVPAAAQHHHGHAADHVAPPADAPQPPAIEPMTGMDHSAMDHGQMDHSAMTPGGTAAPAPAPDRETPPPPEAGSGPPRAADAIWGADAMRASRRDLAVMHGNTPLLWFQADRLEAQPGTGRFLWDVQGYYGGPTSRIWLKSEGEGRLGKRIDEAEVQVLYARAIAPFFDVQGGVRQDLAGPRTTYAVLGIQGLAPYMFELDAALFLSHRGDLTARIEAELDQRITQRLIVQPRAELNLAAQDVPLLGMGAGLDSVEIGVRLRYEIRREFAPYIGVEQQWRTGRGADFARAAGNAPRATRVLAGVRLWF
jgi:copper resistance protein B